jgi:hypothetical protein
LYIVCLTLLTLCRSESTRLREQQDREYRESIEAERLEIERQRAEEESRVAAEEEKRQQEELAAAVALSKKLSREDEIRKLKASFAAAPEPENGPDVSTLRFQLPRAKKLTYRFRKTDKIQVRQIVLLDYRVLSTFFRRKYMTILEFSLLMKAI